MRQILYRCWLPTSHHKTSVWYEINGIFVGFFPEGNSWTKLEFEGPAPPNRLDFAMCSIKLSVPVMSESSAFDAESELTCASVSTKEILERELKPGSASSRGSFSDSASGNFILFTSFFFLPYFLWEIRTLDVNLKLFNVWTCKLALQTKLYGRPTQYDYITFIVIKTYF